jgi:hypothetical protein
MSAKCQKRTSTTRSAVDLAATLHPGLRYALARPDAGNRAPDSNLLEAGIASWDRMRMRTHDPS